MFLKFIRISLCIFLSLFAFKAEAYLQTLSPQSFNALYDLASKGNVSAINNARSRGLNIDSVNANGDTGLCVAAKYRNRKAFKTFLQSGANPSHRCTWEIDGYRDFMRSVVENPVRNMDTAVPAHKGIISSMSLTTKTLIGVGIVAAGAGTAIALSSGGGGGGGSSSVDPNCVHGTWQANVCVCNTGYKGDKCNECDDGYGHYGTDECYLTLPCAHGGVQKGAKCVCPAAYNDGKLCEGCGPDYGKNSSGACVKLSANVYGNTSNTNYNAMREISIINNDYANVYGLFYDAGDTVHWHGLAADKFANAYVDINEKVDIEVETETGTETVSYGVLNAIHKIEIENNSDGRVHGMYSANNVKGTNQPPTTYHNYVVLEDALLVRLGTSETARDEPGISYAYTTITNKGDGDAYGIWAEGKIITGDFDFSTALDGSKANLYSYITVKNNGAGSAYGIYNYHRSSEGTGGISNVYKYEYDAESDKRFTLQSYIDVRNEGSGNAYGMYTINSPIANSGNVYVTSASGNAYGAYTQGGDVTNDKGYDEMSPSEALFATSMSGDAYGVYAQGGSVRNARWISAVSATGNAYGIYFTVPDKSTSEQSEANTVTNGSKITATSTTGNAYGIYNIGGKVINNTQFYAISATSTSGTAVGIYSNGGSVENNGYIEVTGPADTSYGIYATNGATVKNSAPFKFTINGVELSSDTPAGEACTGDITSNCYTSGGGKVIYLDSGATLLNASSISSTTSLNLGSKGVSITSGGSFSATSVSGNLNVANEVVLSGFENEYVLKDAVNTNDASGLTLTSQSVLFDASLNGSDIVLSKKAFADVIENNSSVSDFLEQNYALQNNAALFEDLKEKTNVAALRDSVEKLTGQSVFSRFTTEDMLMEKEFNFDLSEKMFQLKENTFAFSGTVVPQVFSSSSQSHYTLIGQKTNDTSFGVGLAVSDINSSDKDRKNRRVLRHLELTTPFEKNFKGIRFLMNPKLGYAYGTYNRSGYNNKNYDGRIQKRMAGIANTMRYALSYGDFEIAPAAELNFAAYQTKLREEEQTYSLSSPSNKTYSFETGFGLYLSTQKDFSKTSRLEFMTGASLYHEFSDPYAMTLSMNSMNGQFKITDEKRRDDYAVLRSKLSYHFGNVSVYGSFLSYIDSEYRTRADLGLKYAF